MTVAPEDICNQALVEIGYPQRIGSFQDGSAASLSALEVYSQTRDELLRSRDWMFARRCVPLNQVKTAVVPPGTPGPPSSVWTDSQPPPPWLYEYLYPSDCLLLRGLRPTPFYFTGGDPTLPAPIRWVVANDYVPAGNATPSKVILTNLVQALAIYTGQVFDPAQWEPLFLGAVVKAIGRKLVVALSGDPNILKVEEQDAAAVVGSNDAMQG